MVWLVLAEGSMSAKTSIHILLHGFALCGLRGIPRDWADGHSWVSVYDARLATCGACLQRLPTLIADQHSAKVHVVPLKTEVPK